MKKAPTKMGHKSPAKMGHKSPAKKVSAGSVRMAEAILKKAGKEEKSMLAMKKAAMKLKDKSAMMMKKAAMKLKKVSARKMKAKSMAKLMKKK